IEGPWSRATLLYEAPELGAPAVLRGELPEDPKIFVYGARGHPELSRAGELLVSYCVNSNDFWDVAAHANRYRPRFMRVPRALLTSAPRDGTADRVERPLGRHREHDLLEERFFVSGGAFTPRRP